MNTYTLYTYATVDGELVCHTYEPNEDQVLLRNVGAALAVQTPGLAFMVLPTEQLPSLPLT